MKNPNEEQPVDDQRDDDADRGTDDRGRSRSGHTDARNGGVEKDRGDPEQQTMMLCEVTMKTIKNRRGPTS